MKRIGTISRRPCLLVALFALLLHLAAGWQFGMSRPIESDGHFYLELAQNMADGNGYKVTDGFWPDAPTMRRLPGWPAVVAVALKVVPFADANIVMRLLAILINSAAAAAICALTMQLFRRVLPAFLAGVGYACHPSGIYYGLSGFSEPLFLLLAACGLSCLFARSGTTKVFLGGVLLGCASLVRANFVLWSLIALGLLVVSCFRHKRSGGGEPRMLPIVMALIISLLPPLLWMCRNYRVSGSFPVLSSLQGQTFYGGNNTVVAGTRKYWGYWVFPDDIPGEKSMAQLACTMNEFEVDRYYYNRGKEYVRSHLTAYPRLLLGKFVRAYVPVPWSFSVGTAVVSLYRWMLYIAALLGLRTACRRMVPLYGVFLSAMVLTSLFTVFMFWGCARFAFALEPFLLPLAAVCVARQIVRSEPLQRFHRL